jgi:phage shock protein PspC (stress-responsive transcriptional regulator)
MDANDRQQNGPEEEPTAEQGPQAPASEPAGAAPPGGGPPPQKRLLRSQSDRIVGGVCGGLGRYFNVDPLFFRIGAVALAFVGGAGLLLYLAALLLMPSEDQPAPVAGAPQRNRPLVIAGIVVLLIIAWPFLFGGGLLLAGIGIPLAILVGTGVLVWWLVSGEGPSGDARDIARRAALGVGVLILSFLVLIVGAIAAAAGPDWLVPALVIVAGGAIAAGAFLKPVRWLILPAVTLALAAGTVAAAGIDLDGGIGEREYRPASGADLRDHYELGIGELVVDLRDTDLPAGDVPIELEVGIGQARLIVPDDVCVATDADVGMGHVSVLGLDRGGVDVDYEDAPEAEPATTRLLLRADVGMGEVRVHDRRGEFFYDDGDFGPPHDDDRSIELTGAQRGACTTG